MSFQIKPGASWLSPPASAMPVGINSSRIDLAPIVRRYGPEGRNGTGQPCLINDELWAVIGRPRINSVGLLFWYTTVGIGDRPAMDVEVKLFDPQTQNWRTFAGVMWQPTYSGVGIAGGKVAEFSIRFSNLEVIS